MTSVTLIGFLRKLTSLGCPELRWYTSECLLAPFPLIYPNPHKNLTNSRTLQYFTLAMEASHVGVAV